MSEQKQHTRSVDAEGALIAPAAANVESLWLEALDLLFLQNTEIMSNDSGDQLVEIGASVLANLQNDFVHGVRQEICRDQNMPAAESEFRLLISKFHSRTVKFGCGKSKLPIRDNSGFIFPVRDLPR